MRVIARLGAPAVLGALLALGACKPVEQSPGQGSSGIDGTLHNGTLSYAAQDYYEAAPGKPGGTLRVSTASDTTTLDVHSISHGNVQWLGRILFDCLLYQDEQGNISPWLAKSWEISDDGKTYTFHLRDDVTFSDGEKFNARALQVNLEHMRDPATKSPLAAAYIAPYVDGRIVDEYTFEAHLREPYSPFLDVLAQSWLSMISPRQILEAPKTIAEHPIGSGPFVLESYTRDQGANFVKRKGYNWAPAVTRHQGEAYLDRLELSIVPEPMIRFSTLEAGQSDFTVDAPTQNARAIRANPDLQMRSRIRKANPFRSLTFNVERFPFDDVQVRRAVAKAIDRDGLAWITGFGEYLAKGDFLAANTRYYDPAFKDVLAYDVAEANRILDQAGWSERDGQGYRVKSGQRLAAHLLTYETAAYPSSIAVAIQADLKKIGLQIDIDLLPLAQVTQRRYASDFQLIGGGYWHTNTPDGLYILYHSQAISTAKLIGQNAGRFRDAELDRVLSAARQTTDPVELSDLYRIAQQRLAQTIPAVPVFESHVLLAYRKQVKGLIFDTSHNTPLFTSVWLDPEGK
ncbi:ABC transporter substrate-binding protein [Pseudomonas donghuensis]|uniref:ABC transporter substrate-binding protein n=1 Tax=Pseudomonas donghuensis TaxID=1163398 RepID=UPI000C2A445E|nr:ABC transporter substrate-binding protein [Pseudomonas donghuensis]PJY96620.1 ABC transporter substrate-binding protein [Pseudomonas donghuensis]WKY26512.1 ABC transporter substrate-binding protein [Pseudomonas donghuensis]